MGVYGYDHFEVTAGAHEILAGAMEIVRCAKFSP